VNGELAQTMALAAHGSAWLARADGTPPPDLLASNSSFRYVRAVSFTGPAEGAAGDSVVAWLDGLRGRGAQRVWVALGEGGRGIVPEHNAVAFAGGGTWWLLATGSGQDEAWQPSWTLGDRDAPDHKIWDIDLQGSALGAPATPVEPNLDAAADALVLELSSIRRFSAEQQLEGWTEEFDAALAMRDVSAPAIPYTPDLFPASHPPAAARLAAMAARAWVFGGMGSWNDLGFEAPEVTARYDELSRSLYAAVLHALVAAANVAPEHEGDRDG
jgi:hypothetical protein